MTVNYTTLLGLAKPVSGTESGTWGDTVNTNLTDYLDSAVAGTQIISGSLTAVTLSKTTGANLSQAGTGSTGSSQYQIIRCTGNPASLLTITAPAADKTYIIINATSTSQSVKIVGLGPTPTGVTILSGKTSLVAWNGSDFVEVSPNTISGVLPIANGGTNSTATPTAGGVGYGTGTAHAYTAVGTTGQVLTSNGSSAPSWSTPTAATKTISNKTAAYTVVAGDLGSIINCTSGTFTVSLTAAATLGSGFTCTIWNTSNTAADAITIDPAGAETIDGVATLILRRGEGLAVVCDGTNWQTDDKKPMRLYSENTSSASTRPTASGSDSIAMGYGAIASGTGGFAAQGATASGVYALAMSQGVASANRSTAVGQNSSGFPSQAVTGAGAMALGGSYASGTDSFAAGIANNTSTYGATSANSIAIGYQAKSSGQYGSFSLGNNCTASGTGSIALGFNATAVQYGKIAFGAPAGSSYQYGKIILNAQTTTTTAVALTSDGNAASTTNQLIVASGQAMAIQGTLIAKQSGSGNMAGWDITGIVSNNGGTMAVSGLALTAIGSDSITLGAQPTIAVDNTNKGVTITSGYKSATSIKWVATVNTSEVTYA